MNHARQIVAEALDESDIGLTRSEMIHLIGSKVDEWFCSREGHVHIADRVINTVRNTTGKKLKRRKTTNGVVYSWE